jgi:hypothetical protein
VEIVSAITSLIDNTPTLAACVSVNSTFHHLVIPLLYNKVVIAKSEQLPMFLYGIGTMATDSAHRQRKATYLHHLRSLIIKETPYDSFPLHGLSSTADLFPSLRYIEFEHSVLDWEPVLPIFQHMHHIRHVCIRNYKASDICPRDLGEVLKDWVEVEYLTFYNWYAHYNRYDAIRRGVPTTWQRLKEITVFPVLGHRGDILRAPTSRILVPDPFLFMPNPKYFECLTSFTIMVPDDSEVDRGMYEGYSTTFQDDQKVLIKIVKGVTVGNDWA